MDVLSKNSAVNSDHAVLEEIQNPAKDLALQIHMDLNCFVAAVFLPLFIILLYRCTH